MLDTLINEYVCNYVRATTRQLPLSERHLSSVFLAGHELNDVRRQIGAELNVRASVTADLVVARRREYRQHLLANDKSQLLVL